MNTSVMLWFRCRVGFVSAIELELCCGLSGSLYNETCDGLVRKSFDDEPYNRLAAGLETGLRTKLENQL